MIIRIDKLFHRARQLLRSISGATAYPTSIFSITTHATGDVIQATDVNNVENEINAVETGLLNGLQHNLTFLTDNTYDIGKSGANRPRNVYIAGGTIVAGVTTFTNLVTMTSLYVSGPVTATGVARFNGDTFFKSGRPWIDARAYGAKGDNSTNDTTAINNALAAAIPSKSIVFLPPGQYLVDELNFTGAQGVILRGAGINITRINCNSNSNSVVDWSGSQYCGIEDLQIGFSTQTPVPKTAILQLATTGGTGLAVSANWMKNVYVSGKYSIATFYGYGAGDGVLIHDQFYNYDNAVGGAVLKFTNSNSGSMTSSFQTVATGTQGTSDWNFFGTEAHDIAVSSGHSQINTLVLEGTSQMRWYGGVLAGSNSTTVFKSGASSTIVSGPSMYSDNGTQPTYHFYIADTTLVRGLTVSEINLTNPASAVLAIASGGSLRDLVVLSGLQNVTANVLYSEGGSVSPWLADAIVNCSGLQVNAGTNTIPTSVIFLQPGTITATNNALMVGGAGGALGTGATQFLTTAPTVVLKKGSGSANYTTASTTYVDVDATNLAYTATITTGSKLSVWVSGAGYTATAVAEMKVALYDSATLVEQPINASGVGPAAAFSFPWVITGDGASHTVKLQFKTSNGSDSATIINDSATELPTMVFRLETAN